MRRHVFRVSISETNNVSLQQKLVIGKSTKAAMHSEYFGLYRLDRRYRYASNMNSQGLMTVIGTGGLASIFYDATDSIDHIDEDITNAGLVLIYKKSSMEIEGKYKR